MPATTLRSAVDRALTETSAFIGETWHTEEPEERDGLVRVRVLSAEGRQMFSVDLTRVAGLPTGTRSSLLTSWAGAATVRIPEASALLALKWRALLLRSYPKAGDLFDVWFLLHRGVVLSDHHRLALNDDLYAAGVEPAERLEAFGRIDWAAALERSGVPHLDAAAASAVLAVVRTAAAELAP